jgi:hypothetical protein
VSTSLRIRRRGSAVPIYAAVFIDAIYVKVRDGQVGNRPFYAAIGVDLQGRREVLGLWAGAGAGESAKFWLSVLTDLKNGGVTDVFFLVCDGLKGLPDSANAVFPLATVQTSSGDIGPAGGSRWSPAPPRAGPMQTRHLRGPDCRPVRPRRWQAFDRPAGAALRAPR